MDTRAVGDLRPHPDNEAIYGDRADSALVESVKQRGVLNPLLITADGRIISGHRRWGAAQVAGLKALPVILFGSDDELSISEALIESNRQRDKTAEQMAREGLRLLEIEADRAEHRRQAGKRQSDHPENFPDGHGEARDLAAAKLGVSGRTLEKAGKVVRAIDRLKAEGYAERAESLRKTLNGKSVHAAHTQAVNAGLIERASQPERTHPVPVSGARIEVANADDLPLGDASVDLIATSPPYGLDKAYFGADAEPAHWNIAMGCWLNEAYRVARDGGRLAVNIPLDATKGGRRPMYAEIVHEATIRNWSYRFTVVWAEGNVSKSIARGSVDSPASPHVIAPVEMIAVFCKGDWKREGAQSSDLTHEEWLAWTNGLWTFGGESRAWEAHPAAFPEELPRRLIKLLSFPGDTVLDPFCGSGTTPLVAARLGREAIAFDQSPEYVASAKRRVATLVAAS